VQYGANGKFTAPKAFTGGVDCNNTVFGDPLAGVVKWCETRPVATTPAAAPATTAATTTTASTATSAPVNTSPPTVSGPVLVGKTLRASTGTWSNGPTSFGYLWSRCDSNGRNCVAVPLATASTYDIVSADSGGTLVVTVVASNAGGSAFANSAPTSTVK